MGASTRTEESGMGLDFPLRTFLIDDRLLLPPSINEIISSNFKSTRCSGPLITPTRGVEPFFFAW